MTNAYICIMTIRRNMMMRQTIMIKSRTCSSTTCPPTLGRSPQTMAERKIPVQEGGCASFFLFSKIFLAEVQKATFQNLIYLWGCCGSDLFQTKIRFGEFLKSNLSPPFGQILLDLKIPFITYILLKIFTLIHASPATVFFYLTNHIQHTPLTFENISGCVSSILS